MSDPGGGQDGSPQPAADHGPGPEAGQPPAGPNNPRLHRIWQAPLWLLTLGMGIVLFAVVLVGALRSPSTHPIIPVTPGATSSAPSSPATSPIPTSTAPSPPFQTPAPAAGRDLFAVHVRQIEQRYGVRVAIAVTGVADVGKQYTDIWQAGDLGTTPAWGTMDIPIALALLRQQTLPQELSYMLTKAITESTPSADDALYSFLGSDAQAAAATTAVLREFGDPVTTVPDKSTRTGYSAFTQTPWPVASQARLAAQLYCSPPDWRIVSKMQYLDADHSWGMGRIAHAYYKTSSGPDDQGRTVLRQVAIVPTSDGQRVGVGLAVIADDGQQETAQEAANALAGTVYFDAVGFDAGRCAAADSR